MSCLRDGAPARVKWVGAEWRAWRIKVSNFGGIGGNTRMLC